MAPMDLLEEYSALLLLRNDISSVVPELPVEVVDGDLANYVSISLISEFIDMNVWIEEGDFIYAISDIRVDRDVLERDKLGLVGSRYATVMAIALMNGWATRMQEFYSQGIGDDPEGSVDLFSEVVAPCLRIKYFTDAWIAKEKAKTG